MSNSYEEISNEHLETNQFSIEIIEKNINNFNLLTILTTQKLTPEFCIKYLYLLNNNKYTKNDCDEEIYLHDILKYQSHITKKELEYYINLHHNNSI
jgi:hypothetical protein